MSAGPATAGGFTAIDPVDGPGRIPSFMQGALVHAGARVLFLSGQAPQDAQGRVPESFDDQCRLAWTNLIAVLAAADMTVANLVKVTVLLTDRADRAANARIRQEFLGDHRPCLMGLICELWVDSWLLEIEAVAAA